MNSRGLKTQSNFFVRISLLIADIIVLLAGHYAVQLVFSVLCSWKIEFPPKTMFFYLYAVFYVVISVGMDMYVLEVTSRSNIVSNLLLISVVSFLSSVIFNSFLFDNPSSLYVVIFVALSVLLTTSLKLAINRILIQVVERTNLLVIEAQGVDNAFVRKIKYSSLGHFNSWYTQIDVESQAAIEEFLKGEFTQYDCIFIAQGIPEHVKKRLISEAINAGKEIFISPTLFDIKITKYELMQFDDILSFRIKPLTISKGHAIAKRIMDIVLSLVGIVLSLPITIPCAIAIKLTSLGPVFYWQKRVTKDGALFNVYKFRTMVKDAEKISGPVLAADNDPRITKVGKFLRRTRIDEIPQLINVLKGDMSIVGPRPERPEFVRRYCEEIEDYDKRHSFKAGLTGFAQVYARYDTTAKDKLLYDLIYIHDYSFWLDIKIIILTIKTLFSKRSAAGVKVNEWDSPPKKEVSV